MAVLRQSACGQDEEKLRPLRRWLAGLVGSVLPSLIDLISILYVVLVLCIQLRSSTIATLQWQYQLSLLVGWLFTRAPGRIIHQPCTSTIHFYHVRVACRSPLRLHSCCSRLWQRLSKKGPLSSSKQTSRCNRYPVRLLHISHEHSPVAACRRPCALPGAARGDRFPYHSPSCTALDRVHCHCVSRSPHHFVSEGRRTRGIEQSAAAHWISASRPRQAVAITCFQFACPPSSLNISPTFHR